MKRTIDMERIEKAIREILLAIGENPEREGLKETPFRVAKVFKEFFEHDSISMTSFENTKGYNQMILLRNIQFFSLCEHHLLPFFGLVTIGYIPLRRILGLSKFARVVEKFSGSLQTQENFTQELGEFLFKSLEPEGLGVLVEGLHLCLVMRGVKKERATLLTSALYGSFLKEPECREEFLRLAQGGSGGKFWFD